LVLGPLLIFSTPRPAQLPEKKTITAIPSTGSIKIDGILDESAWQTPGDGKFRQSDPIDGELPSESTKVWIAYDRDAVYIAARLGDSRPDLIVSRLGRRDELVDSDWFTFTVDPYLDFRSGFLFAVNPAGSILDGTLFNDEERDLTWDGIWESATRIDSQGWTVEMRIPFGQLRFKSRDEYQWGVNFQRTIKRKNETVWFSWRPKTENGFVSRFALLEGIRNIRTTRRIEFLPYLMTSMETHPAEAGNPFRTGLEKAANLGFDFKVGLRSNLTLDATANPDFGQVEVDPAVINISDQETYYQEKRPFFIEGASIFNFGRGGPNVYKSYGWTDPAFFYSRRIGRSPQGDTVTDGFVQTPDWTTILGAAKLTGKIGNGFNLGLISALTSREYAVIDQSGIRTREEIEPLSFYGVVRGVQEFREGNSGLGFIATAMVRDPANPTLEASLSRSAFAFGLDGWTVLDSNKVWSLSGWFGGTTVAGSAFAMTRLQLSPLHYFQRPDADYLRVDETTTSLSGYAGRLYLNKQKGNLIFNTAIGLISPGFEANDIGFHNRGDLINGHLEFGYQSFTPSRSLRRWKATTAYYRNYDFSWHRIGEYIFLDGEVQFLNYWTAAARLDYEPDKTSHYLTRGGPMAYYPSGATAQIKLASDDRKHLIGQFNTYYRYHPSGGYTISAGGGLTWKPKANFSLSITPSYQFRFAESQWIRQVTDPLKLKTNGIRYVFSNIDQKILAIEIRLNWAFTPKLSLQAYLQPYIGTGNYFSFKEYKEPLTFDFDYYGENGSTITLNETTYTVDPDGAGPAHPFSFADPDFNSKSVRGTVILRWEYRPGSRLFLVWTQRRLDTGHPGDFDLKRDFTALWKVPGENIFMVKWTHRFDF